MIRGLYPSPSKQGSLEVSFTKTGGEDECLRAIKNITKIGRTSRVTKRKSGEKVSEDESSSHWDLERNSPEITACWVELPTPGDPAGSLFQIQGGTRPAFIGPKEDITSMSQVLWIRTESQYSD